MSTFNLSQAVFTHSSDVIEPGLTIFNPKTSKIRTLKGSDRLIGSATLNGDFGFGAIVAVGAQDFGSITAASEFINQLSLSVKGIENNGSIYTNRGQDIVRGTANTNVSATTDTVSQVIAIASTFDTQVINDVFASFDLQVWAEGIDNSGGEIRTGKGNDTVGGDSIGSISAAATATVDASAIVEAVAAAPYSENLQAFATAIATSLTTAKISATGINNQAGQLITEEGRDTLWAYAASDSGTFSDTFSSSLTDAPPENTAAAMAIADAVATASDTAIAIDNTQGLIQTGPGGDGINATATANETAIAINNVDGLISTGKGRDTIRAEAEGDESFGIFGGRVQLGSGSDSLIAETFGGGVKINAGNGDDYIEGFGDAKVYGGSGFDILSLESYSRDDFDISVGARNNLNFSLDGMTLFAKGFEQFNFANDVTYDYQQLATA